MATKISNLSVTFNDNTEQKTALAQGIILLWSGSISNIPTGWQLCNGTNGTPDLRDRFVIGAGSSYSVGATGGSTTVSLATPQLPPHTHTVTISSVSPAGSHRHGTSFASSTGSWSHTHSLSPSTIATYADGSPNNYYTTPATGQFGDTRATQPAGSHNHTGSTSSSGGHVHGVSTVSVGPIGAGDPHENRPPYYALAFIMEVS